MADCSVVLGFGVQGSGLRGGISSAQIWRDRARKSGVGGWQHVAHSVCVDQIRNLENLAIPFYLPHCAKHPHLS